MTYDKKKWMMISATIVAILIVVWQVRAMVNSDFVPAKSATKPVAQQITRHQGTSREASSQASVASLRPDSGKAALYVQLAKEIELAKMQRQLLEEKVAIARAEQRLAAMHSVAAPMTSFSQISSTILQGPAHRYRLLALSNQSNKGWQAMIEVDGQLLSVRVGQQLPNGDEIIHMGHDQVWIDQHNKAIALSFEGLQTLSMRAVDMARKAAHVNQVQPLPKKVKKEEVKVTSPSAVKASFGRQEKSHIQVQEQAQVQAQGHTQAQEHVIAIPKPKSESKLDDSKKEKALKPKHLNVSLESASPAWMNPVTYLIKV